MKSILALLALFAALALPSSGQALTNLTPAAAKAVLTNSITPDAQAAIAELTRLNNLAVAKLPGWATTTNTVDTGTNVISTVTTNHVTMTLAETTASVLADEKISRIIIARCSQILHDLKLLAGVKTTDGY